MIKKNLVQCNKLFCWRIHSCTQGKTRLTSYINQLLFSQYRENQFTAQSRPVSTGSLDLIRVAENPDETGINTRINFACEVFELVDFILINLTEHKLGPSRFCRRFWFRSSHTENYEGVIVLRDETDDWYVCVCVYMCMCTIVDYLDIRTISLAQQFVKSGEM